MRYIEFIVVIVVVLINTFRYINILGFLEITRAAGECTLWFYNWSIPL